ncbi:MAG TPA: hypothetical protein VNJ01_05340 [Bacteriovoracaceae bacterium]|nr:hypothetical protein [Bacteriovoracaceae bacterium]
MSLKESKFLFGGIAKIDSLVSSASSPDVEARCVSPDPRTGAKDGELVCENGVERMYDVGLPSCWRNEGSC